MQSSLRPPLTVQSHIMYGLLITAILSYSLGVCTPAFASTASWYDYNSCLKEGSNGRFTASGERFNSNDLTAASRKYPFGTKVKVTNKLNNKSVIVKVNDLGPNKRLFNAGREIDLSRAAFHKIAPLSSGVVPVIVEAL